MDNEIGVLFENVKNSKKNFMFFWSLSDVGTNHPSITSKVVSCSKVGLGEPDSSN